MEKTTHTQPQYRIKYLNCQQTNHHDQKLNLVCIEQSCRKCSLICSLCRQEIHKDHLTRPFKFYLQQLNTKYSTHHGNYKIQLQQLQNTRSLLLAKIREVVQNIAQEFRLFEKEILDRFDQIRNQILQKESEKNRFAQFYFNLTQHNQQQTQLAIENYMQNKQPNDISNLQPLNQLNIGLNSAIRKTKQLILRGNNGIVACYEHAVNIMEQVFWKPGNIKKEGDIFTQTCTDDLKAPSMCIFLHPVDILVGKVRIKVLQLRENAKIVFGIVQNSYGKAMNHIWKQQKTKQIRWICHNGQNHQNYAGTLKYFTEGSELQLSYSNQNFTISSKKSKCSIEVPTGEVFNIFFVIQGKAKLEVVYPA